jgi:CHASE3 domain sensor protein
METTADRTLGRTAGPARRRDRFGRRRGLHLAPHRKVLASMLVLLTLLAAAVVGAVLLIIDLNNNASQFTDSQVEYATAIQAAALHAKGIANDERGFLLSGDREFIREIDVRTGNARAAFSVAANAAEGAQRQAVAEAHEGFEHWVQAVRLETATFQAGNRQQAVAASLGPTRALRKSYERSLARARALGVNALESGRTSVAAVTSRSVAILLGYLLVALAIGIVLTFWVVRTVLRPVQAASRLVREDEDIEQLVARGRLSLLEEGDDDRATRGLDDRAFALSRRWLLEDPAGERREEGLGKAPVD